MLLNQGGLNSNNNAAVNGATTMKQRPTNGRSMPPPVQKASEGNLNSGFLNENSTNNNSSTNLYSQTQSNFYSQSQQQQLYSDVHFSVKDKISHSKKSSNGHQHVLLQNTNIQQQNVYQTPYKDHQQIITNNQTLTQQDSNPSHPQNLINSFNKIHLQHQQSADKASKNLVYNNKTQNGGNGIIEQFNSYINSGKVKERDLSVGRESAATRQNKAGMYFPHINRGNSYGNNIQGERNGEFEGVSRRNERSLSQGSNTQRGKNSGGSELRHKDSLLMNENYKQDKKQFQTRDQQTKDNRQGANQIELLSNQSQIEIDPVHPVTSVSIIEVPSLLGKFQNQLEHQQTDVPINAYSNVQFDQRGVQSSMMPMISKTQTNTSPEKKSFRIKYNHSVKRTHSSSKNDNYDTSTMNNNKQSTKIIDLKAAATSNQNKNEGTPLVIDNRAEGGTSGLRSINKKHSSNVQSTKDITLLNNPHQHQSHSVVNTFFVQNGLTQQEKLKLIDALNIQPIQQKKMQQMAKISAKIQGSQLLQQNALNNLIQHVRDPLENYINKNVLNEQLGIQKQQQSQSSNQSPMKSSTQKLTPTETLIQTLKLQALQQQPSNQVQNPTNLSSANQSQANLLNIKNSNKDNYNRNLDSPVKNHALSKSGGGAGSCLDHANQVIQDFRRISQARQSVSPGKTGNSHQQRNQYFKLGNGLYGELQPLGGLHQHQVDHSNSFQVAPNITYEQKYPNAAPSNTNIINLKSTESNLQTRKNSSSNLPSSLNLMSAQQLQALKFSTNQQLQQQYYSPIILTSQPSSSQLLSNTHQPTVILGNKNSLLSGMIATKKEQQDLKKELEAMKQNKRQADEYFLIESFLKNDKLSYESLNQINHLIQSQRALKDRMKVGSINNNISNGLIGQQMPILFDLTGAQAMALHQASMLQIKGIESPYQLIKTLLEAKTIKESGYGSGDVSSRSNLNLKNDDIGLSKLLSRTLENYKNAGGNKSMPLSQVSSNNTPRAGLNQQNQSFKQSIVSNISPSIKSKLKANPNSMLSPRNIVPSLSPETKIKIYHQPSNSLMDHPINIAISKINYIIKLIFKSHKNLQLHLNLPINVQNNLAGGNSGNNNNNQNSSNISSNNIQAAALLQNLSNQPPHIQEEAKLNEIQRMAKQFGIQIKKRFDNKTALREFFQSREFITNLKQKMNQMLYNAINESNGMNQILNQSQNNNTNSNNTGSNNNQQKETNYNNNIQGSKITAVNNTENQINNNSNTNTGYQQLHKFYVGRGNNDAAVKSVLKQRSWWIQHTDEDFSDVNLIWTQWKKQKHIDYLANNGSNQFGKAIRLYGKIEQNKQLTNKKGVFINMRNYYLSMEQDPFEVLPLTFLVKHSVNDPEFKRFTDYYNSFVSKAKIIEQQKAEAISSRQKHLQEIRDQKAQERQLKNGPASIVLPSLKKKSKGYESEEEEDEDYEGSDYSEENSFETNVLDQDDEIKEIKRKYRVPKNVWIIKPGENTNRGNGINVSSNFNEIKNLVQRANSNAKKEKTYIIQKYIDYPLLIHNRKFDFRCYGLMTSINGYLKGYFYEDAYIRTSCKEFDIDNLSNKIIHLTNDAVQKHSQDYGKFENGNKMSLQDFQKYLKLQYPNLHIDIKRDIMPQIRALITDSYRSAYGKIDPGRLHNTFELFGYDFMLDEDLRLYLIEVNTNPCLEMSCPLLCRIIPEVLDNAFKIVLDPIFPSPDLNNNKKYSINEIPQEIKFTLVFDETVDGPELRKLQNKFHGIKEEIESDEESELAQDEANELATVNAGGLGESSSGTSSNQISMQNN